MLSRVAAKDATGSEASGTFGKDRNRVGIDNRNTPLYVSQSTMA
jgi:hypothetical protein